MQQPLTDSGSSLFNWAKLYSDLDKVAKTIKQPEDTLDSFGDALISCRKAENCLTSVYIKMSSHLVLAKQVLKECDLKFKIRDKHGDDCDVELEAKSEAKQRVDSITIFIDCVNKLLSVVKHTREDIGRRIKLLDIQKDIKEI